MPDTDDDDDDDAPAKALGVEVVVIPDAVEDAAAAAGAVDPPNPVEAAAAFWLETEALN